MTEERLFPQHPLFWVMLNEYRRVSRLSPLITKRDINMWVLGFKWGWIRGGFDECGKC